MVADTRDHADLEMNFLMLGLWEARSSFLSWMPSAYILSINSPLAGVTFNGFPFLIIRILLKKIVISLGHKLIVSFSNSGKSPNESG